MTEDKQFGTIVFKLKELMESRKMTPQQLEEAAKLTRQGVKGLLSGMNERYDKLTLAKLCHALKCQPGDLLEYRPD